MADDTVNGNLNPGYPNDLVDLVDAEAAGKEPAASEVPKKRTARKKG